MGGAGDGCVFFAVSQEKAKSTHLQFWVTRKVGLQEKLDWYLQTFVYFSDKVEGRRSRQQPLGKEGGMAGYLDSWDGGDDDDDDAAARERFEKMGSERHRYHSTLEFLQRAS